MIRRIGQKVTLRSRMVASFAFIILVLGVGGTLHARFTVSSITADELDQRGLAIARDVEGRAGELLLTNDIFGLYRRVKDLAEANPDVRYIVVLDGAGAVKASTFSYGLPQGLRQANEVQPRTGYSLKTVSTTEGDVRDVAYEIQGQGGTVRVGLSTVRPSQEVDDLTMNLLALTGGAFIGGLGLSFVLATMLTRPLSRLALAARAVAGGEPYVPQASLYEHPEVGNVAQAFDSMTQRLQAKEEERGRLLARVMEAQEDERMRISRELHDEAGQSLTSLLMGLGQLERTAGCEVAPQVSSLRESAVQALDRLRELARELRPSILDDLGLIPALRRYVSEWGAKFAVETDFHTASVAETRFPPTIETAVYRISQEALTNVARHARANSVDVLIERRGDDLVLVISDDGTGFTASVAKRSDTNGQHLGIAGMQERAALLGGTLRIESTPGLGTEVFLTLPLPEAAP